MNFRRTLANDAVAMTIGTIFRDARYSPGRSFPVVAGRDRCASQVEEGRLNSRTALEIGRLNKFL